MAPENSNKAIELQILIDGNVPPGGGLSSSAAMVVSSAIATLKAFEAVEATSQGQLATIAIDSGKSTTLLGTLSYLEHRPICIVQHRKACGRQFGRHGPVGEYIQS